MYLIDLSIKSERFAMSLTRRAFRMGKVSPWIGLLWSIMLFCRMSWARALRGITLEGVLYFWRYVDIIACEFDEILTIGAYWMGFWKVLFWSILIWECCLRNSLFLIQLRLLGLAGEFF